MANTTDWNISRQIVWGIPIPAKICDECGHTFPDLENNIDICENVMVKFTKIPIHLTHGSLRGNGH